MPKTQKFFSWKGLRILQRLKSMPEKEGKRDRRDFNLKLYLMSLVFIFILMINDASYGYWQIPENLTAINSSEGELDPSISSDGNTLYFHSDPNRLGGSDIWVSHKVDGEWQAPVNLKAVNSSSHDSNPCISFDGNTLYFYSARPGGLGGAGIWVSQKVDGEWQPPVNLGAPINTPDGGGGPSISSDGNTLYFHSPRPGGLGENDIWVSQKVNGVWQSPTNLGAVNSPSGEQNPSISSDGNTLYFDSSRSGLVEIWESKKEGGIWQAPIKLGNPISFKQAGSPSIAAGGPSISSDGNKLYFHSWRPGGLGSSDIWVSTRTDQPPTDIPLLPSVKLDSWVKTPFMS